MSTKIYNAYSIRNLSTLELKEFQKELKEFVLEKSVDMYLEFLAKETMELSEELYLLDYFENFERVGDKILYAYNDSIRVEDALRGAIDGTNPYESDVDEVIKKFQEARIYRSSPRYLATEIIKRKMREAELRKDIMNMEYDFSNSLCLFPLNKSKTLFVGFGSQVTSVLSDICYGEDNKEYISFRERYNLKDYHYQNQTDRPENVSAREWTKRKNDWDKVIPSGTYGENGIVVKLLDSETFSDYIVDKTVVGDCGKKITSKAKRIEEYAVNFARDEYFDEAMKGIPEPTFHDSMHIVNKFDKLFKAREDEVMFIVSDKYEEVKNLVKESSDILVEATKSILDFVPNFMKERSK